jgi:hypothetical protein
LLAQRAWPTAIAIAAASIAAKGVIAISSLLFGQHMSAMPGLAAAAQHSSFPSDYAVMAGVVFGCLALLVSRGMGRWAQALVAAACGIIVIAISFSRLYLGVNWLSDVIAGLLHAGVIITFFSVAVATWPARRIRPLGLLASALVVFLAAATLHISADYDKAEDHYGPADKMISYSLADWLNTGWQNNQTHRVDLAGKPEEVFAAQWLGSLPALQGALQTEGFKPQSIWTWRDSFPYLDPNAKLASLPPRPALHQGLKAKLTAVELAPASPSTRQTVRVFASNSLITGSPSTSVYLISLTQEVLRPHFHLFSVPSDQPPTEQEYAAFLAKLTAQASVENLGSRTIDGKTILILRPRQ